MDNYQAIQEHLHAVYMHTAASRGQRQPHSGRWSVAARILFEYGPHLSPHEEKKDGTKTYKVFWQKILNPLSGKTSLAFQPIVNMLRLNKHGAKKEIEELTDKDLSGQKLGQWLKDPEALEMDPATKTGRAVYLVEVLSALACIKDQERTAFPDMFKRPREDSLYERLCKGLLASVGLFGQDMERVYRVCATMPSTDYEANQDPETLELEDLLAKSILYIDREGLEILRPLIADLLEHHERLGFDLEDDLFDDVYDDDGELLDSFPIETPAADEQENLEALKARLAQWAIKEDPIPAELAEWHTPRGIDIRA